MQLSNFKAELVRNINGILCCMVSTLVRVKLQILKVLDKECIQAQIVLLIVIFDSIDELILTLEALAMRKGPIELPMIDKQRLIVEEESTVITGASEEMLFIISRVYCIVELKVENRLPSAIVSLQVISDKYAIESDVS